MNEMTLGTLASAGIVVLAVHCFLWMFGGRTGTKKLWRRYVGSAVGGTYVNIMSVITTVWGAWLLAVLPALIIGSSMGYGGDTTGEKVIRRTLFCLGNTVAGIFCCLHFGGVCWWLFVVHVIVAIGSIVLGVKNPVHAAPEEVFVCATLNLILYAYPFLKIIS